jgi:hypothetical protein
MRLAIGAAMAAGMVLGGWEPAGAQQVLNLGLSPQ